MKKLAASLLMMATFGCAAFQDQPVSPEYARARAKCMREAQQTYGNPSGISPEAMEKQNYIRYCLAGEGF